MIVKVSDKIELSVEPAEWNDEYEVRLGEQLIGTLYQHKPWMWIYENDHEYGSEVTLENAVESLYISERNDR